MTKITNANEEALRKILTEDPLIIQINKQIVAFAISMGFLLKLLNLDEEANEVLLDSIITNAKKAIKEEMKA